MKQFFEEIEFLTTGQGLEEITQRVELFISQSDITNGIVNINCLHTSASLVVQENASTDVLADLRDFFNQTAPMDNSLYRHRIEGKDDMPAHIKTALTQTHLTLSIKNSALVLGSWQGIFLFEHRLVPHYRKILVHIMGE